MIKELYLCDLSRNKTCTKEYCYIGEDELDQRVVCGTNSQ